MKMRLKLFLILFLCFPSFIYSQCALKMNSNIYSENLGSTGNRILDKSIHEEELKLEDYFNINVDLNICSGTNGMAMSNCQTQSNCDGTIELGKDLITYFFNNEAFGVNEGGKWMVIAIMAHEFAHILQYKHRMKFRSNVQQEIHADILAGWYIAKYLDDIMGISNDRYFGTLSETGKKHYDLKSGIQLAFAHMGDKEYSSPYHHGNNFARFMAVYHGVDQYDRGSHNDGSGKNAWSWQDIFIKFGPGDAQGIIDKWNN